MELVKTTSFDEFMTEYNELMNVNENFNSNGNGEIITETNQEDSSLDRRDFLKYSALGTATLIMGATTEKAEAFAPIVIGLIALGATAWASDEYIDWEITLANKNKRKTLTEHGRFKLVKSEKYSKGRKYANLDTTTETFRIPPDTANTYRSCSLKANVDRDIYAFVHAKFGRKKTKSRSFKIYGS